MLGRELLCVMLPRENDMAHNKSKLGVARSASSARGYTAAWRRARLEFLGRHPWCVMHLALGQHVLANVVDHVVPHRGDPVLFWDRSNWQALCKLCHDSYKQRQDLTGRVVGCDVDGVPLDANHHWNKSK